MGQFIHDFTEYTGTVPTGAYIPISINSGTYKVPTSSIISSGSGSVSTLNDLSDVLVPTPVSGDVLKYNGSYWEAGTDLTTSGSNSRLSGLVDVNITGSNSGWVLTYNSSISKWESQQSKILQTVAVDYTGTTSFSTTGFVPIISGNIRPKMSTSRILIWCVLSTQASSDPGLFKVNQMLTLTSASGDVLVGADSPPRTQVTIGQTKHSNDNCLYPMVLIGSRAHNTTTFLQFTVMGKCQNPGDIIYINRTALDTSGVSTPRGYSSLILMEAAQ